MEPPDTFVVLPVELTAGMGTVKTTSRAFKPVFFWTPTGIPLPLSVTVAEPSGLSVTDTALQCPGQRLVHRIVHNLPDQVVEPWADVLPTYMAGRMRTASRPSRI